MNEEEILEPLKFPWRITFDTNPDDCNLHCIMCEEFSEYSNIKQIRIKNGMPPKRRMEFSLIEKVIREIYEAGGKVYEIIPSTMGEPLLYKDFEKILELCAEYDIKINITTNGTFPRKKAEEWARLIVPICSDIKISWNGVTKETAESIMKGINFEKAVQNLKDFIKVRNEVFQNGGNFCRVTLQPTFMVKNYKELPELVKFAAELGVNRIKGHHLWVHFEEMKDQSLRKDPETIKEWNKTVKKIYKYAEKYRLPNGEKIILDNIHPLNEKYEEQFDPEWICPFLGREAWVAWDGRFNPCCAPDEERKKLGYFGNLKEVSLLEIWNSPKYRDLIKNYQNYEVCKKCNMRRPKEDIIKILGKIL